MLKVAPETGLLTSSPSPLPAIVLDPREPGELQAALHGALRVAGQRQELVAVVLIPLGASPLSWSHPSIPAALSAAREALAIDVAAHEVFLRGRPVPLTAREFALLHYLYLHRGHLVGRRELLREVWGESYSGGPRTIDIHIRRLRSKLGADSIETVRGIGYKFRRSFSTP